jgi:adenine-specific DNA-methyltransferase
MNKTDLIQKVKAIDGLNQDERAYLVNLVNTKKKYGLVWEDKPEEVEEQLRENLPVLKEVKEKAIINCDEHPNHILIEGDNLHALTALTFSHEGKIDVIYIDPPYNTGNKDFRYNDTFKDEHIDKENPFRHSTWLSFMNRRLKIAKKLLSENGVIFISIDENECYQLKLLCDEIFGQVNFIADHIWKSKSGGAGDASFIATDTENIILYAKDASKLALQNDLEATITTSYNRVDENGNRYALERLDKQSIRYSESLDYLIKGPDGTEYWPKHKDPLQPNATWRWGKETVKQKYDELVFEADNIYTKNYERQDGAKPRNLLIEERFGRTRTGKTELYSIIGANDFTAPKPSRLIAYLIKLFPNTNARILDFFAGSGTTLQAVMQLNSLDGGRRIGIVCTNNENAICENVTYPRIFNVINGYESKGNSQVELFEERLTLTKLKKADKILQQVNDLKKENEARYSNIKVEVKDNSIIVWGESKKGELITGLTNNNLRYYKSDFVSNERSEVNRRKLTQLSTELICIKEDCYKDLTSESGLNESACKIFTNGQGKYLIVVYHSRNLTNVFKQLVKYIKTLDTKEKVRLYGFSPEKETLLAEFIEVEDKIEAIPIPEAIYNAYKAVTRTLMLDSKYSETTNESYLVEDEGNPTIISGEGE